MSIGQTTYAKTISAAFAGMKGDSGNDNVDSRINGEASAGMPFGIFVAQKGSGADAQCILPAANTLKILAGVVLHSHSYSPAWTDAAGTVHGELGSGGLVPGSRLSVMRRGRVWMLCETAAEVGDPVFVRYTTDGGSPAWTAQGCVGNATGTGRDFDCSTKARFASSVVGAPAQGSYKLALIEVDMSTV